MEFLSFGRPLDAEARRVRLLRALDRVREAGADHLVLTGDLTEDGADAQFEVLAEVLHDAGVRPEAVTILPENHHAYIDVDAFERRIVATKQMAGDGSWGSDGAPEEFIADIAVGSDEADPQWADISVACNGLHLPTHEPVHRSRA